MDSNKHDILHSTLLQQFQAIPANAICWIAYSGGLDSQVLVHAIKNSTLKHAFRVIHIHHGLSKNADHWAEFCRKTAEKQGFPFICEKVNATPTKGESPEAAARRVRYAAFRKHLKNDEYLITAHHQNDQAETLLIQLLRGAGVKGASAMPVKAHESNKTIILRPFLNISQQSLQAYADHFQLEWIEDESNSNTRFDRNYLRHEVIPIIEKRWPNTVKTLARATAHFAEAQSLLDELAEQDYTLLKDDNHERIHLPGLQKLSQLRQQNLCRYWLRLHHWHFPSREQCRHFLLQLSAPSTKNPRLQTSSWTLQRYQQWVYLNPPITPHDPDTHYHWDGESEFVLPNGLGVLSPEVIQPDWAHPITIRFYRGNEKIQLSGRQHHHLLRKLWQQWGVPPWERERIPLIYAGDRLVSVVGYT